MKELTLNKSEIKMIMSYVIGTSEVVKIFAKYDEDGNKGMLISNIINEICYLKFVLEKLKTRFKTAEARLAEISEIHDSDILTTMLTPQERD